MNEYQRQAYLDALGLEQYVPRWRLPRAPEPFACELPVYREAAANERSAPTEAPAAPQPRAVTEVLRDIDSSSSSSSPADPPPASPPSDGSMPESGGAAAPPAATGTDAPTAEPPAASEPAAPFSVGLWLSPLPLLVLDAREPRAALPTDRLLRNLLSALVPQDGARVAAQATEEVLQWPSVNNPAVRQSAADAEAELQVWLDAKFSGRPASARRLLLMGEAACRHLLPAGQSYEDALWETHTLPMFDTPALVAPSLADLLREPALKRPLWRALQAWLPMEPV